MAYSRSFVTGLLGLSLSVAAWVATGFFPVIMASSGAGPEFFPRIVAAALGLTSVCLVVSGWYHKDAARKETMGSLPRVKFVLLLACLIAYAFGMVKLGYFFTTFLFSIVASLIAYWKVNGRNILYVALNALVICSIIYCVFKIVFKFTLPGGLFF